MSGDRDLNIEEMLGDLRTNEEIDRRLGKIEEIRRLGLDPFGGRYDVTSTAEDVVVRCDALMGTKVSVAGRLTAFRQHGKATFADLETGRVGCKSTLEKTCWVRKAMQTLPTCWT